MCVCVCDVCGVCVCVCLSPLKAVIFLPMFTKHGMGEMLLETYLGTET